jgi:hypothetical protein
MFLAALFLFNIPVGVLLGAFDKATQNAAHKVKKNIQQWRAYQASATRGMEEYAMIKKLTPRAGTLQWRLFEFVTEPWISVQWLASIPPTEKQMSAFYARIDYCFCWSCRCCRLVERRVFKSRADETSVLEMNEISRRSSVRDGTDEDVDGAIELARINAKGAEGGAEASGDEDDGAAGRSMVRADVSSRGIDVDSDGAADTFVVSKAESTKNNHVVMDDHTKLKQTVGAKKHVCSCLHAAIAKWHTELRSALGCTPIKVSFDLSFDLAIMTFIILNTTTMMVTYFGASSLLAESRLSIVYFVCSSARTFNLHAFIVSRADHLRFLRSPHTHQACRTTTRRRSAWRT